MLVVGLTGGIATGKSTVAELFRRHGLPVLDADRAARELTLPGSPVLGALRARFGSGVFTPGGELDREALARIVFADAAARRDLEGMLHPVIYQRLQAELERLRALPQPPVLVVVELPLLFEVEVPLPIDITLAVTATAEQQRQRLEAVGMSREQICQRMQAQMAVAQKAAKADLVLENTGSRADLEQRFEARIWPRLGEMAGGGQSCQGRVRGRC